MIWHTFFQPFIEYGFMRRALVVCLALSDGRGILAGRVFFHLDSHPFGKYST